MIERIRGSASASRRSLAVIAAVLAALAAGGCTPRIADHEPQDIASQYSGGLTQDQGFTFTRSSDHVYAGTASAKAAYDGSGSGSDGAATGTYNVGGANGTNEFSYGAAFYLEPGTLSGSDPRQKHRFDILRWRPQSTSSDYYGGVAVFQGDHKARLVQGQVSDDLDDSAQQIGAAFDLGEGCWNWLMVRQKLSQAPAGDPDHAQNELWVNGTKVVDSPEPNTDGFGARKVSYGLLTDPSKQTTPIDLHIDNSYFFKFAAPNGVNSCYAPPPDPTDLPADSDPEQSNPPLAEANSFLYEGEGAVQTGVDQGAIEQERGAVVRGKVTDAAGDPLGDVNVTVKDQPELGSATSQPDGEVYMVVNGGGSLTMHFEKPGFIPADRKLEVPWDDYANFEDVTLLPFDDEATDIDVSSPLTPTQVAQGSEATDADGTRTPTVIVPEGTHAEMRMPDGTMQSLDSMRVRMTEFTVGPNGEESMPAPLPPTSAYTWAAEFSVDEAIAAGAEKVEFSDPVYGYVENFVGFPVGTVVPSGSYDNDKAAWVPEENDRVVGIVNEQGGLAEVDTTGDNQADNGDGLTDPEREKLAMLYDPGDELWRVPMEHFSKWDFNWGFAPPGDAASPNGHLGRGLVDGDCIEAGSQIGCLNQTLGEELPIAGTPHSIHYQSDRTPGFKESRKLRIPLTNGDTPASVKSIELEIEVAGRRFTDSFTPSPNLVHTFVWDGHDVFGRELQGIQPVTLRIGYTYDGAYTQTSRFGYAGNGEIITGSPTRREVTLWQREQKTTIGGSNAHNAVGLGGWTLGSHHFYDTRGQTLYLGDGRRRSGLGTGKVISTVAGDGSWFGGNSGDGGPAVLARVGRPLGLAIAPDGGLYIAESSGTSIRHVSPTGIITTTASGFDYPTDVSLAQDGSLYVNERDAYRVRKIDKTGAISTVAGTGVKGFSGDGGLATEAQVDARGVTAARDGGFYIADEGNHRVRRVGPDGVITTVAGTGAVGSDGDGGPATEASLTAPTRVVEGSDRALYVAEFSGHRIRRIGPDGIITTVAGTGENGHDGDGGPAVNAVLGEPDGVTTTPGGSVLFSNFGLNSNNNRIQSIALDGIIHTVAGSSGGFGGDEGPAGASKLDGPAGMAVGPDGALYVADFRNSRVRRFSQALGGFGNGDISIPSEDGSELYIFNERGRHLRTLNTQTGATVYSFTYDSEGRLSKVTDGDGNQTRIDHDPEGNPTQIIGPDGHKTELEVNPEGYLSTIRDPAGKETHVGYYSGGLLHTFSDYKGNTSTMTYDSQGRLIRDDDAEGGSKTLSRSESDSGREVTLTTALGRTKSHGFEDLPTGDQERTSTLSDGTQVVTNRGSDGSRDTTLPDGTTIKRTRGPDPRFGMLAPVNSNVEVDKPSGLKSVITTSRLASLSNPDDPLSHSQLSSTATVNGRTYTEVFDRQSSGIVSTTPAGRASATTIDGQGRPISVSVPGIDQVGFVYDARGRPVYVQQGTRAQTITYDAKGNVATTTDSLGRTVSFTYDAVGRPLTQTLPDQRVITYTYDANGNLTSLSPPQRPAHDFSHNAIDQTSSYTAPDLGAGTERSTNYSYTSDHELSFVDRPGSADIDYAYDSAGRLSSITEPVGTYGFGYDSGTGQLMSISAPGGVATAFAYDGDLPTSETQSGPVAGETSRTYDANFWITSTSVNGASTVNYGYDNDGLLASAGPLTLQRSAANGLLSGTTQGPVQTTLTRNTYGEPASLQASYSATPLLSQIYTRDAGGRIADKQETTDLGSSTYSYTYDATGRLTEVKKNGSTEVTYAYDANGNRTTVTRPGQGMLFATYDAQDRLLTYGTKSYNYTQAGELASMYDGQTGQTTDYDYDAQGGLRHVGLPGGDQLDYLIDGQGQRVGKKRNGQLEQGFLYGAEAQGPVAQLDQNGDLRSRFVYATRENVPDYMTKAGQTYRIVTDDLGSPRVIVNTASGSVAQRMDYDEFGNVVRDTNPGFQPFGYAGGLYDSDTKLVRFGARDYDPQTGRFTSKDPIGFSGGDTNLYGYVLADPVNLVDPSGTWYKAPKFIHDGAKAFDENVLDPIGDEVGTRASNLYDSDLQYIDDTIDALMHPDFGKCDCGSFAERTSDNFVKTNTFVPGLAAPSGSSFLVSRQLAKQAGVSSFPSIVKRKAWGELGKAYGVRSLGWRGASAAWLGGTGIGSAARAWLYSCDH